MKAFEECLEGHFTNKYQAMKDPSRYAHINISHVKIGDHMFYGEQAYNHLTTAPYRQFILIVVPQEDAYIVQNYAIDDPKRYSQMRNLHELAEKPLQRRLGCDIIFKREGEIYKGTTASNDCLIDYKGRKTYLQNDIEINEDSYWVLDKGFDLETDQQVWGAKWGHLKFYRRHDMI